MKLSKDNIEMVSKHTRGSKMAGKVRVLAGQVELPKFGLRAHVKVEGKS